MKPDSPKPGASAQSREDSSDRSGESLQSRLPNPIRPETVAYLNRHLVQLTDQAFADASARSGPHLACRPGCTQCCHGAFAIHALDAWRLRTGMAELAERNPERAQAVRERAERYIGEYGHSFPGDPITGILGTSDEEQEAFEEFANKAACPALDPATGLCDLYDARPMTCRVFGPPVRSLALNPEESEDEGLAVCELCFTHATEEEILAAELHPPRDEEQTLLEAISEAVEKTSQTTPGSETIVAWCLI